MCRNRASGRETLQQVVCSVAAFWIVDMACKRTCILLFTHGKTYSVNSLLMKASILKLVENVEYWSLQSFGIKRLWSSFGYITP